MIGYPVLHKTLKAQNLSLRDNNYLVKFFKTNFKTRRSLRHIE